MRGKKLFIAISFFLFLTSFIYLFFIVKKSYSPTNRLPLVILPDTTLKTKINYTLQKPYIIDSQFVWCKIKYHDNLKDSSIHSIAQIDLKSNTINVLNYNFTQNFNITGFALYSTYPIFLIKYDDNSYFFMSLLMNSKKTKIKIYPQPEDLPYQQLRAFHFVNKNLEIIAATYPDSLFIKYKFNENDYIWTTQSIYKSAIIKKISTPYLAYYNDGWRFIALSKYNHINDKFLPIHPSKTNILFFKNDFEYYYDNTILNVKNVKNLTNIDKSISGILYNPKCFNDTLLFIEKTLKTMTCSYTCKYNQIYSINKNGNVFFMPQCYELPNKIKSSNGEIFLTIDTLKSLKHIKLFTLQHGNSQNIIAKTENQFNEALLIDKERTILLSNGEYCKFTEKLERLDSQSGFNKFKKLIIENLKYVVQSPLSFKSYTIIIYTLGMPFFTVIAFLLFFVKKVFLTPHHPSYSRRYVKPVLFSNFLFPFSIIYIILFFVYLPQLIEIIKYY